MMESALSLQGWRDGSTASRRVVRGKELAENSFSSNSPWWN